jgi:hypothetical protein
VDGVACAVHRVERTYKSACVVHVTVCALHRVERTYKSACVVRVERTYKSGCFLNRIHIEQTPERSHLRQLVLLIQTPGP